MVEPSFRAIKRLLLKALTHPLILISVGEGFVSNKCIILFCCMIFILINKDTSTYKKIKMSYEFSFSSSNSVSDNI